MDDVSVSNFEVTCKKCGRKLEPQYYDPNEKSSEARKEKE